MKRDMHIALVEDNRFHAMLFRQAVKDRYPDFEVSVFATGKEFIKTLNSGDVDLISVDFNLPDMDGLQLLSIIRSEK